MAKNLKLKIKNTQLAEVLKQKQKAKEEPEKPKKAVAKKATAKKGLLKKPGALKKETPVKVAVPQKPAAKQETPAAPEKVAQAPAVEKATEKPAAKVAKEAPQQKPPSKSVPKAKTMAVKDKPGTSSKPSSYQDITKREKGSFPPDKKEEGFRAQFSRTSRDFKAKKLEARQGSSFDARDRQGLRVGEENAWRRRRKPKHFHTKEQIEIVRPKTLSVRIPITVKDLAQQMKLKASELIAKFFKQGAILTINDYLEDETTIQLLGHEFDCEITIDTTEEERLRITDKTIQEEIQETDTKELRPRAPVVAFMGHVDHGKTSLIDAIRKSNITSSEAGAITQHIGAFRCHRESGDLTVLDTPGHEAFSMMRQRGAAITDVIVLVVAGDEGIMPQTEEAMNQAKEAAVPMIVAINKSDKASFAPDEIYRQLADRELLPEAWGGTTITVNCSATTGEGVSDLLEMLILQADILELKANPNTRARGSVLESQMHKGLGPIATILIQNGTLKKGQAIVFEDVYARVKTMHDENGQTIEVAGPSTPVKITGLSGIPDAGCEFIVVDNEKEARKLCEERASSGVKRAQIFKKSESMEQVIQRHQERVEKKILNLILKADVHGSIEAIKHSLFDIKTEKVELNFISEGVGEISESDVELAAVSNAPIIGFHTSIESHAAELIKNKKVMIKQYDIIYQVIDAVRELMLGTLDKLRKETEVGTFTTQKLFKASHIGVIAGGQVAEGVIKRSQYAKVLRDGEVIWEGTINSIKRGKEDAKEVSKGLECGIVLNNFNDFQVDDQIKTFDVTYVAQEL